MSSRLIVALDFPDQEAALGFVTSAGLTNYL